MNLIDTISWPLLWISGLAILLIKIGVLIFGPQSEAMEISIYLILGAVLPILVLIVTIFSDHLKSTTQLLKFSLSAIFWIAAASFCSVPDLACITISTIQILAIRKLNLSKTESAHAFLFSLFSWCLARRLVYWSTAWFHFWFLPLFVFFLTFSVLNVSFLFPSILKKLNAKLKIKPIIVDILNLTLLGFASWKVGFDFHHGSFYAGPALLVRQGGLLLWDVPSQYGFLNILLIALLPAKSIWQALYIVNSSAIFLSAIFSYFIIRKIIDDNCGKFVAAIIVLSIMLMLPGITVQFNGANAYPSTGGLRFVWCYALLFSVLHHQSFSRLGSLFFILSFFWSAESAIYGMAIWFPNLVLRELIDQDKLVFNVSRILRSILNIAVMVAVIAIILFSIYKYYSIHYGVHPDWYAFYEYSMVYQKGFYAELINFHGLVWVAILLFAAILVQLQLSWKSNLQGFLPSISALTTFWIVSSYFVSRSHENNLLNLMPLYITSIAVTIQSVPVDREKRIGEFLSTRLLLIPILTVSISITIGNRFIFPPYLKSVLRVPLDPGIDTYIPKLSNEVENLLRKAKVKITDPFVSSDRFLLGKAKDRNIQDEPTLWLPLAPEWQLCVLSLERQKVYISRFLERHRNSGWLLMSKKEINDSHCMKDKSVILEYYSKVEEFESENWELGRYQIK